MKIINRLWIIGFLIVLVTACSTTSRSVPKANNTTDNQALADINLRLSIAYLERGNLPRAKQKLLYAQAQSPKDPAVWYTSGYFYEKIGDLSDAKKAYERSLKLAPNSGTVQNNYGTYLCRHGKYQESIQHFLLAINDPNYLDTAYAYENAGLCALKIPNQNKALQFFLNALKQNPNLPNSLLQVAQINYNLRNYSAAKTYLSSYNAIASPNEQSLQLTKNLAKL